MSKTIHVKPVETLAIELTDKTYVVYFNMLCLANLQEQFVKCKGNVNEIPPAKMVSMILLSGINAGADEDHITEEEANALAIQLPPSSYGDIMNMYFDSVMDSLDDDKKEVAKKMMAQITAKAVTQSTSA